MDAIEAQSPQRLDAIIYNLGIWETRAFEDDYSFLQDDDAQILEMVSVNIGATLLLLKRLLPRLLGGAKPHLPSTSQLRKLQQAKDSSATPTAVSQRPGRCQARRGGRGSDIRGAGGLGRQRTSSVRSCQADRL